MRHREIGKSGIQASVIALGAWPIGGGPWWGKTDDEESIRTVQAAIDMGVTLIDTAPVYGFGRSEEVIGRAIKGRRDKVVLATKCGLWWKDNRGFEFFQSEGRTVRRCLRPETIRVEVEESLQRLGVDVIDLLQTHWQEEGPGSTPIAETMGCLVDLQKAGKVRAIGVSNCSPAQMDEYRKVGRIDSNQPRYSMLDRYIEGDVLPYCRKNGISTLAYSPLEQGLLTGAITMASTFSPDEYRNNLPWLAPANRKKVLDMLWGWADLLKKYNCTLAQLVIAWTLQQDGLTFVLCGGRKAKHIADNAGAGDLVLDEATLTRMRNDVESLGEPQ
ncbi:MAG: aldo/keto reductase [Planctomycetaceae bacterium]|nr:aldo/keto reductase [Planctomycetaceae bacterium]